MKIKKVILPVAGFGTRLIPATKAQPKEMLPVVDKPAIQYLVEEAVEAGIEEIIFVTGRGKRSIEDHFDHSFELEHTLVEKHKYKLLEKVKKISEIAKFSYVRQPFPLGNGHAIKCAAHLLNDEPVLVMFGDTLYDYDGKSPSKQIIEVYEKYRHPVIGLSEVDSDEVNKFGIIDGIEIDKDLYKIKGFVEKPQPGEAPTNLAAVGAYVITPDVIEVLKKTKKGRTGEIGLDDAFYSLMKNNKVLFGKKLEGEWLDTGSKFNYLKANIKLGLKDEEIGVDLKRYIKNLAKEFQVMPKGR